MMSSNINSDVLKRLKRAHGHLASVVNMLEKDRECLDVAQQLHAVERAIGNAKQTLIREHIGECIESGAKDRRSVSKAVRTFKEITKYL